MIECTRNILTPKGILHVYEVYEGGASRLMYTTPVKYVIMGHEFARPGDVAPWFKMPSDWFYRRLNRYWKSPFGFPATWREILGASTLDLKAIHTAKCATLEAAEAIIKQRIKSVPIGNLRPLLTRHRRLSRVFPTIALSAR